MQELSIGSKPLGCYVGGTAISLPASAESKDKKKPRMMLWSEWPGTFLTFFALLHGEGRLVVSS